MSSAREFDEPLEVTTRQTVTGHLRAGAMIRTGGHLVVTGHVEGVIVVEENAFLTVTGTFFGQLVENRGLVTISGMADVNVLDSPGRIMFGAETLLDRDDDVLKLHRDGSVETIDGDVLGGSSNIDGTHFVTWDRERQEFRPLAI